MPELAEVVFHASQWRRSLGERFELKWLNVRARCCRTLVREEVGAAFSDAALTDGLTHGKRMLFVFRNELFLEAHLGMSGSLHREPVDAKLGKHDHFALVSKEALLVFRDPRQFGKLTLHCGGTLPQWWRDLPPQPHDPAFTRKRFEEICARRSRSAIKPALLDQELFPGIGNWMADETLWQARIRPGRAFVSLAPEERSRLYRALRSVCRGALKTVGKDYSDPPEDWLFRHRWRPGGNCPRTGEPLARSTIGGRSTCWSPAWQR